MSSPSSKHVYWRQLTALAPTGELTDDEIFQLADHLDDCPECRELLKEYEAAASMYAFLDTPDVTDDTEELTGRHLLGQREARNRVTSLLTESGLVRHEPRTRPVPIRTQPASTRGRKLGAIATAAIGCAALLVAGIAIWSIQQRSHEAARQAEARASALRAELEKAAGRIEALESSQAALRAQIDSKSRDASALERRGAQTSSALTELSSAHQADLLMLDELKLKLKTIGADLDSARSESRALTAQKLDLEAKLQESARSSSAQAGDQQKRVAQLEGRIQDLTKRSQDQLAAIQRQEKLLSTDRDIRDLMGARNLHIIDAADNTAGRQEPWFGRVFYTEGKSLVFYAFDLDRQKNLTRSAAFQVWGEKQGLKLKARSLGVFYLDQKTQDRWILRFEDPDVLAQIDRVYVTVEPPGGSASPHGKELLATNLAIPANHP